MKAAIPLALALLMSLLVTTIPTEANNTPQRQKVIIDTDIGDDIDDAFAVALALRSPELEILGFSTAFGATETRAKILDRMLGETGHESIPVAVGIPTPYPPEADAVPTQARYGTANQRFLRKTHPGAVDFILDQIRRYPGQITLVTIGPLVNIGALIDKDPNTFRKVQRIVMMGGWISPVSPAFGNSPAWPPRPEWNIKLDIAGAQKLFQSGVPLYVMPIDSTIQLQLDEVNRTILFSQGNPLTDALTLLYHQWAASGRPTPILFDPMTLAFILDPTLCPMQPMHINVDDQGFTRSEPGKPNAQVCLHSDKDAFIRFYMGRIAPPSTPP